MTDETPSRPVLRWHGGKWLLAPWIVDHFPAHRVYVEPFGGAGSVLLRKPRAYAEIFNDLDGEVVNLFRVLRDADLSARLRDHLALTPFARAEFEAAYEPSEDPVERARRMIVRSFMGHSSVGAMGRSTGFRSNSTRSGKVPAADWAGIPDALAAVTARLLAAPGGGVVIEQRDATEVLLMHDSAETLHYVDPPYVHETRSRGNPYCLKHRYRFELDDAGHARLLDTLRGLRGMVVLSGYPCRLYDEALRDWTRVERPARADGARPRTEVLWINPAARDRRGPPSLFGAELVA